MQSTMPLGQRGSETQPFLCWGYFHPKHKDAKIFENYLNPVVELFFEKLSLSTLSTNVPCFGYFSSFFASFCVGQISHQQQKG